MLTRTEFLKLAVSVPLLAEQPPLLTRQEIEKRQQAWRDAIRPPIACVFKDADITLYSSAVNGVTCWVDIGSVTWLGTRLGVKRVEKGKPPRHYTQRDGLPNGKITAIAGDERGVYVLITVGDQEALYGLDSKSDRWNSLASWPLGRLQENDKSSPGLLALTPEVVVASPRVVSTGSAEPLFCFDRALGQRRSLPWNAAVRTDHRQFIVSYLRCQEKTVRLGTSIGLLELPLSADGGPWTRRLIDFSITGGVEGAGTLYLWLTKRAPGSVSENLDNFGALHVIDTTRWNAKPLPTGRLSAPSTPSRAAVDSTGALWLVYPHPEGMNPIFFGGPASNIGIFYCWQPGATHWKGYRNDGSDITQPAPQREVNPFVMPVIAGAKEIPDAPARLAALDDGQLSFFHLYQLNPEGNINASPSMALQWVRARFPHWLSPDVFKELLAIPEIQSAPYCFALRDLEKPGLAWTGRPGELVTVASSSLPARILPPEGKPGSAAWLTALPDLPAQQHAALPKMTFALHANLRKMFPLEKGRWLALGKRAFLIEQDGKTWQELALPPDEHRPYGFMEGAEHVFPLGQEIFAIYGSPRGLLRMEPKTRKLVPMDLEIPQSVDFLGATSSGVWWRDREERTFMRLLPSGQGFEKHQLPILEGFNPDYYNVQLAAGCLWCRGYEEGNYVLRGWSPETNAWSPAVTIGSSFSLWEESPHTCLLLTRQNSGQQFMVQRWEAKNSRWVDVEPFAVKLPEGEPVLQGVDDKSIWLSTSRMLHRWDRRGDTVQSFTWPTEEMLPISDGSRIISSKDAFFLVSSRGLWRLDRKSYTWTEWTIPVSAEQAIPKVVASDGQTLWGTLEAFSNVATCVFRFSPKSGQFTFYGKKEGVPEGSLEHLVSDGKAAWIRKPRGTYRYDAAAGRFVLIMPLPTLNLARDAGGTWLSVQPNQSDEPTLFYRRDATGRLEPEVQSVRKGGGPILTVPEGLLVSTNRALYQVTEPGSWKLVDTQGITPTTLQLSSDNRVWISGPEGLLSLRLSSLKNPVQ